MRICDGKVSVLRDLLLFSRFGTSKSQEPMAEVNANSRHRPLESSTLSQERWNIVPLKDSGSQGLASLAAATWMHERSKTGGTLSSLI